MKYHVFWEASIDADSDVDAAKIAMEMICEPDSLARFFSVGERKGKKLNFTQYRQIEVKDYER
jgi:hypothetical protein